MSILSTNDVLQLNRQVHPYGYADRILNSLASYNFDMSSVETYDERVKQEIKAGVEDLRKIKTVNTKSLIWFSERKMKDLALNGDDSILRDQAIWNLINTKNKDIHSILIHSIQSAPTTELAISALIALHKVAHYDPDIVANFLNDLALDSNIELAEWARLHLIEMGASLPGNIDFLNEPASDRDFVYKPSNIFDVTMPLVFHCDAYTKLGPATVHNVISPSWFSKIFGKAMACVRQETFKTNLVLEKQVNGLHKDGSEHYEHFPFSGTTDQLSNGVFRHNYWAQLYRPFYTSGRTEVVSKEYPVIRNVPMSFCRVATTYAPQKYWINNKPIPESVRGIFFGYGHISPKILLETKLDINVGDFQLSSKINPHTHQPANTFFHGTFFGKLGDWDGDGKLDLNARPVHCDAQGRLDYYGNKKMSPDPICPEDWVRMPNYSETLY